MKKKLGLAALLMAVLLLVPSFAMAAPAEEPTTVVYTLQVPVVNENGANYEIPLKITLYDVYEDSDLSKLVSVQKAAEGTSFELWLNLSGVSLGSITGIDHNGNYVSIYARSTGYYKGSWYSSKPGFKSLSTRGTHTCSYGNTVTTQPSCEAARPAPASIAAIRTSKPPATLWVTNSASIFTTITRPALPTARRRANALAAARRIR